jgi:hypothetical protein
MAPANLMMARLATAGMASIQFEKEGQLTKRLQATRAAKDEFWNRWVMEEVFLIKTIDPTEKRRNGI